MFLLVTSQPACLLSAIIFQTRWPEEKDPCCQRALSPGNGDAQDLCNVMYLFFKALKQRWECWPAAGMKWADQSVKGQGSCVMTSNTVCSHLLQNYHWKWRKITFEMCNRHCRNPEKHISGSPCHRGLLQLNSLGAWAHVCTWVLPTLFEGKSELVLPWI